MAYQVRYHSAYEPRYRTYEEAVEVAKKKSLVGETKYDVFAETCVVSTPLPPMCYVQAIISSPEPVQARVEKCTIND